MKRLWQWNETESYKGVLCEVNIDGKIVGESNSCCLEVWMAEIAINETRFGKYN